MEAGNPTAYKGLAEIEVVGVAVFLPVFPVFCRKYHDDIESWIRLEETLEGDLQYGLASDFQKLLRQLCTHAGTAASGHHHKVSFSLHAKTLLGKVREYDRNPEIFSYFWAIM